MNTTEDTSDTPLGDVPILNIKQIMVPLDLSHRANKALKYAIRVAQQFEAEILLVHVVTEMGYEGLVIPSTLQHLQNDLLKQVHEELEKMVKLEDQFRIKIKTKVLFGEPAHEISKIAGEEETDLILVSTEGRTGLSHVLVGSTAEKIVRHAPCPVLVVREKEHEFIDEQPSS